MCGIAGIVDLKADREIDRNSLQRMTDALAHRGPDDEAFYFAPGIGFGHRRLSIIDLEGGAQPFVTQDNNCVLTYNGEIYNYTTLARKLGQQSVILRTRSDTEVLAESLRLEGPSFISELRGMFAFAFWNAKDQKLLLARDRLGEKPLYYAITDDGFLVFASELGALTASKIVTLELDPEAVSDYFLYGFVPDPKSIFKRIHKLPPGATLSARKGSEPVLNRYWRPEFHPQDDTNFHDSCEELLALLDDAVTTEMVSDVSLGAFLSGGVDSSAVVASMAASGGTVKTCSIGFKESGFDERSYAREVSSLFKTDHREQVAEIDATCMIDTIAHTYGEPFADPSALPTYMVSKLARESVKVALSGDGGDEVFAGYRRHVFFRNEERLRAVAPQSVRSALFGVGGAIYPKLDWAPRPLRFRTTLQSLAKESGTAYAHAMAANLPQRIEPLLSSDLKDTLGGYRPESVVENAIGAEHEHPLIHAQRADLAVWLPGRMLTKVDRASMAHSLEVRPPLLDHRLVEWAGRLPAEAKLQGANGKRLLKAALEGRLPSKILYRKKQGFALPVAEWLRAKEGPLQQMLSSNAWRQCSLLNEKGVEKLATKHIQGRSDCSQELWSIIMFDAFLRRGAGSETL